MKSLASRAAARPFVVDFELAYWLAAGEVPPSGNKRGRFFHWRQFVYREIHWRQLGLSKVYENDPDKRHVARAPMASPLLPDSDAPSGVDFLAPLNPYPSARPLLAYVRSTWFFHRTFTPESWSVFGHMARTMNDADGAAPPPLRRSWLAGGSPSTASVASSKKKPRWPGCMRPRRRPGRTTVSSGI